MTRTFTHCRLEESLALAADFPGSNVRPVNFTFLAFCGLPQKSGTRGAERVGGSTKEDGPKNSLE
jgi:hypothetical protein